MPKSEYALPGKKAFPLNDKVHQRMAIGGATRSERAGNISEAQADAIKAKARKKFGVKPNGMDHDTSMGGYDHDDVQHTSKHR